MLIPYGNCCEIIRATHGFAPKKVLHIGAHVGEEAYSYQCNEVEQVIWFEANVDLVPKLESNLREFHLVQQIIPVALWNENKRLIFKVTNNMQSSSFFDLKKHTEHYPDIKVVEEHGIMAYRLDQLLAVNSSPLLFSDFDFINIDTQGAELAILQGMGSYLWQKSVKAVYLEINREELYTGIPLVSEIDSFLAPHYLRVKTHWTPQGWGDALYLRSNTNE